MLGHGFAFIRCCDTIMANYLVPVILLSLSLLIQTSNTVAISAYWTPIIARVCSPTVPKNVTQALYACDKLMDRQLATIFDDCVRSVNQLQTNDPLTRPKLCYYLRMGVQLDRCKMARYQSDGITLPELVEKEQDHTWCLMKIAQPLGWEKLCSDLPGDLNFLVARQDQVQNCEKRFAEISGPIRDCFKEQVLRSPVTPASFLLGDRARARNERMKPAACLSFQYSRKIWKCLAEKDNKQTMQRRANQYVSCLRAIRNPPSTSPQPSPNQSNLQST